MAGIVPNEGKHLMGQLLLERVLTDRDADLELGLFTNSTVDASTTHATITEPTGTGYARITLTDGTWTGAAAVFSYGQQTFTAGGTWTGSVYGYFIATKTSGGTKRLIAVETDPSGPYTFAQNDTYKITPQVTIT